MLAGIAVAASFGATQTKKTSRWNQVENDTDRCRASLLSMVRTCCAEASWYLHSIDFVAKALFQEAEPNSNLIRIMKGLKFNEHLKQTHTQYRSDQQEVLNTLKHLCDVCFYLVEERQDVSHRAYLFQSFHEVSGLTGGDVLDVDCSQSVIFEFLVQEQHEFKPHKQQECKPHTLGNVWACLIHLSWSLQHLWSPKCKSGYSHNTFVSSETDRSPTETKASQCWKQPQLFSIVTFLQCCITYMHKKNEIQYYSWLKSNPKIKRRRYRSHWNAAVHCMKTQFRPTENKVLPRWRVDDVLHLPHTRHEGKSLDGKKWQQPHWLSLTKFNSMLKDAKLHKDGINYNLYCNLIPTMHVWGMTYMFSSTFLNPNGTSRVATSASV